MLGGFLMNNNYQTNLSNILNQFLCNIAVEVTKMYNIHWNLVGPNFLGLHKKYQEYYEKFSDMFDQVAERIKMVGGFPITNVQMFEQGSTVKSIASKDYPANEAIPITIADFGILLSMAKTINDLATKANDSNTSGLMGDYESFFEKQLWMLKAQLK